MDKYRKIKLVGYVSAKKLAAIQEQGRSETLTVWEVAYAADHIPIYAQEDMLAEFALASPS